MRLLILKGGAFSASPLADLPPADYAVRWSDDASVLSWTDAEGVKLWRCETDHIRCLLRWLRDPAGDCSLWFSPRGKHLMAILGPMDTSRARILVIRLADGAATPIGALPRSVGIAEWEGDDEVYIGYDFSAGTQGSWGYQATECIRLTDLPTPWYLPVDADLPLETSNATTQVRHRGHDYSCLLQGLQTSGGEGGCDLALHLADYEEAICRAHLGLADRAAQEIVALAVVSGATEDRFLLVGISGETGGITRLASFQLAEPAPADLRLTVQPLSRRGAALAPRAFRVPVVSSPASFECATPEVKNVAIWVHSRWDGAVR